MELSDEARANLRLMQFLGDTRPATEQERAQRGLTPSSGSGTCRSPFAQFQWSHLCYAAALFTGWRVTRWTSDLMEDTRVLVNDVAQNVAVKSLGLFEVCFMCLQASVMAITVCYIASLALQLRQRASGDDPEPDPEPFFRR